MEIRVKCRCGEVDKCVEWAIVELQGVVEIQPPYQDQIQGLEIGRLCGAPAESEETYTFIIGYHELTGSKLKLNKPLLVLQKKKKEVPSMDTRVELDVIGIIRHKILFKTRPKPLLSKPQPVVKEKPAKMGSATHT